MLDEREVVLRMPQNVPGAFPYQVFGRFTDISLPLVYIVFGALCGRFGFGQCTPDSDCCP